MKGAHQVVIENKRLRYDFTIHRNITVIRGNSATGKTTLIGMLSLYQQNGEASGVRLSCDKACVVINSVRWQENLAVIRDSIVFIDEDDHFVKSQEFAEAIQASDNYYVIITRDRLPSLPYSVTEIYGIRVSGKYAGLKQVYNEFYRIYGNTADAEKADICVTEDSNSGYQFLKYALAEHSSEMACVSASGKSNIPAKILALKDRHPLVFADGAAFGPEMERVDRLREQGFHLLLFLPESFEWLILKSALINEGEVSRILEQPEDFIESREYFSWERFFTDLLRRKTNRTYLHYDKAEINPAYLQDSVSSQIVAEFPEKVKKLLGIYEKK